MRIVVGTGLRHQRPHTAIGERQHMNVGGVTEGEVGDRRGAERDVRAIG